MRKCLMFLIIIASPAIAAKGDGKFFVREKVPAGIPYQRAILLFGQGQETLILQSKYDLAQSAGAHSLGWVVPVPTVPELAAIDANEAATLFRGLSLQTRPHVTRISVGIWFVTMVVLVMVLVLLLRLLRDARLHPDAPSRTKKARQIRIALFVSVTTLLLGGIWMPPLSSVRGTNDVEVVKAGQVGIYDAKVVRGQNAEAITDWLVGNGFSFNDGDRQVFKDYVDRGWCFVTARVHRDPETDEKKIVSEGLVAPLILKFNTGQPIYPLALTATTGTETEVLIYTVSNAKLTCGSRLTLHHADGAGLRGAYRSLLFQGMTGKLPLPEGFIETPKMLCKFQGILTPEQMKQDLEFTLTPDDRPYRERKIVW